MSSSNSSKPGHAFGRLEASLAPLTARLLAHPLYGELRSLEDIRALMESHVYAVWDFMSLVKALQRAVTCVEVPWLPAGDATLARFLNEIVLGEESDEVAPGVYMSHCELYLAAMDEVGADARPFRRFLTLARSGEAPLRALQRANAPAHARAFVSGTLLAASSPAHCAAASFLFGREDVIPGMFRKILAEVDALGDPRLKSLRLYLDRHIAVDEGSHGPLARRLLTRLCGADARRWRQARAAAAAAIEARLLFWDAARRALPARARAAR